jgi:uncharacterized membrane protein
MRFIIAYVTVATSFAAIDMVWLGIMAERLYRPTLGEILRPEPDLLPAVFFYLFYPLGLLTFAVLPACTETVWCDVRLLHLRNLRSYEPGDTAQLVDDVDPCRHRLGFLARSYQWLSRIFSSSSGRVTS